MEQINNIKFLCPSRHHTVLVILLSIILIIFCSITYLLCPAGSVHQLDVFSNLEDVNEIWTFGSSNPFGFMYWWEIDEPHLSIFEKKIRRKLFKNPKLREIFHITDHVDREIENEFKRLNKYTQLVAKYEKRILALQSEAISNQDKGIAPDAHMKGRYEVTLNKLKKSMKTLEVISQNIRDLDNY